MEQLPPKPPIHNWSLFQFQMMPPSSAASNSWMDEFLDFSAMRRNSHRRTVSDPIAFVEESIPDSHNSNGFDGLDDEQLRNMFSDDIAGVSNPSSTNPSSPSSEDEEKKFHTAEQHQVQPKDEPVEVDAQPMTKFSDDVSGDAIVDPKRIKRILANRQSAQRSRVRKLQYISELERSVTTLQTEVSTLSPRVAFLDHQRLLLNVDNSALKQRIAALAQDKLFKDAHQEALKKEIERLRNVYHEQNLKKMAESDETTATADAPPSGMNKMGCMVEE